MRAVQRATSLGMARVVDFVYWTDIPLTVDANMSEVVTFKTCCMVARVVAGERSIDRYPMDSSHSINFVMKFSTLEG